MLTRPLEEAVDTSNYEKFQTGNPVVRRLIDRFYGKVGGLVSAVRPESVLDAGCGEGETLERLAGLLPASVTGIDLNPDSVEFAARRIPDGSFSVADLTALPFEDDSFDLVLCLEVLEHIADPAPALAELSRVCRGDIVLSVPSEPWFRLGSLARGKYLEGWGNHPEHVNHWNPRSLRAFLDSEADVVTVERSTPWLVAHARPRRPSA
jgi:2-polyprenyl-3-methyl-5-hydroxy-6-metoxy-1,4-benzoquinol methylase